MKNVGRYNRHAPRETSQNNERARERVCAYPVESVCACIPRMLPLYQARQINVSLLIFFLVLSSPASVLTAGELPGSFLMSPTFDWVCTCVFVLV